MLFIKHVSIIYYLISLVIVVKIEAVVDGLLSLQGEENPNDATVYLSTNSDRTFLVKFRNVECVKCKLLDLAQISSSLNATVKMGTQFPLYYFTVFERHSTQQHCVDSLQNGFKFIESANYSFEILETNNSKINCTWTTLGKPSMPVYLPLLVAAISLPILGLVYALAKFFYKRYSKTSRAYLDSRVVNSDLGVASSSYANLIEDEYQQQQQQQLQQQASRKNLNRVKSVDVLRGISLAVMIFVNYGSGGYYILDHSIWNGLHLADLVFPCFIFVMGISIPLSLRSLSNKSVDRSGQRTIKMTTVLRKLVQRSLLMFFFGLIISNSSDQYLSHLRIMGVLQRFAVSYFVCTLIELIYFKMNNFIYISVNLGEQDFTWNASTIRFLKSKFKEIFLYPIQWLFVALFILIWTLITFLVPVEGCPTGYLGPGGLHENGSHFNCTGGVAGYIDRLLLGPNHVFKRPTANYVYLSGMPYDPEGLLGCFTSCVLTYFGMIAGHVIIHYQEPLKRITRFLFYGITTGVIGAVLCQFRWEDGWIPINKNLWSLSYIFVMASISFMAFTALYILIDVYDVYSGTPFLYLGRNSITVYMGHEIMGEFFPLFKVPDKHAYHLALNFYWISLWCIVAAIMDYKKVYINL